MGGSLRALPEPSVCHAKRTPAGAPAGTPNDEGDLLMPRPRRPSETASDVSLSLLTESGAAPSPSSQTLTCCGAQGQIGRRPDFALFYVYLRDLRARQARADPTAMARAMPRASRAILPPRPPPLGPIATTRARARRERIGAMALFGNLTRANPSPRWALLSPPCLFRPPRNVTA